MKLKPDQRVDFETAKLRALRYLAKQDRQSLTAANAVAIEIWPDHQMTSQGAGAGASRILKRLEKDGLVYWNVNPHNWGYAITSAGRGLLEKEGAK